MILRKIYEQHSRCVSLILSIILVAVVYIGCDSNGGENGDDCPEPLPHEEYCINPIGWECNYTGSYCEDGIWKCVEWREHPPPPPEFEDWAWRCQLYYCDAWNIPSEPGEDWQDPIPYVPPDPNSLTGEWHMESDSDDVVPAGCEKQPIQYAKGNHMVVDPTNPNTIYVGFGVRYSSISNTVSGVFKSVDGGETWFEARARLGWEGCPLMPGYYCEYGPDVRFLYMDPEDSETIFASTTERGLYRTTDGAEFWEYIEMPSYCSSMGPIGRSPNGAYHSACGGMYFRSQDGGDTWEEISYLGRAIRYVYSFAFDERFPDVVWAGMGEAPQIVEGEGYLFRSDDSGSTWVERGQEIDVECKGRGGVYSIDICEADPNQMAASVYLCGLFISEDGGVSWRKASSPMDGLYVMSSKYQPSTTVCRLYSSEWLEGETYWTEDAGRIWEREHNKSLDLLFFNPFIPDVVLGILLRDGPSDKSFELWKKE